MTFLIVGGIILAGALWLMLSYNSLVTLKNRTKEAWADIDVQLKRRYDLIPNLMNTVKGYAAHEKEVLQKLTEARANMASAQNPEDYANADNMLSGALKSLFAVAENYPDLKANQNFLELQKQLEDTENKIQSARRFYNGNVRDFNTKIEQFPSSVVANIFGFKAREFFELDESQQEAKEPVKVDF